MSFKNLDPEKPSKSQQRDISQLDFQENEATKPVLKPDNKMEFNGLPLQMTLKHITLSTYGNKNSNAV